MKALRDGENLNKKRWEGENFQREKHEEKNKAPSCSFWLKNVVLRGDEQDGR